MKVTRVQAEENRNRVIEVAGQLFREHGFNGIGIADLMKAAGLTHGGFYGSFKSKEDLTAQACQAAFEQSEREWTETVDNAGTEALVALVKAYLSPRARGARGRGCIVAALASDAARHGSSIRTSFTTGIQSYLNILTKIVPGRNKEAKRKKAVAVLAEMVGTLVLARAVNDKLASEILATATADLLARAKEPRARPEAQISRRRRSVAEGGRANSAAGTHRPQRRSTS
jgi:TetR/AcrR family transcriptional repressor of nem operon